MLATVIVGVFLKIAKVSNRKASVVVFLKLR